MGVQERATQCTIALQTEPSICTGMSVCMQLHMPALMDRGGGQASYISINSCQSDLTKLRAQRQGRTTALSAS